MGRELAGREKSCLHHCYYYVDFLLLFIQREKAPGWVLTFLPLAQISNGHTFEDDSESEPCLIARTRPSHYNKGRWYSGWVDFRWDELCKRR